MTSDRTSVLPGQAQGPSRRAIIASAALLGVAGVAEMLRPRHIDRPSVPQGALVVLPKKVGQWTVAPTGDVILPDGGPDTGIYDQILGVNYQAAGAPEVMVLAAYCGLQTGPHRMHRPEVCYDASGFKLENSHPIKFHVKDQTAWDGRSLIARRGDRVEFINYWSRIGNSFPTDTSSQNKILLQDSFRGIIPDGILVRFSVIQRHDQITEAFLNDFANEMIANLDPTSKKLLLGEALFHKLGG